MQYILLLLVLAIPSQTADIKTCSCSQLVTQFECNNAIDSQINSQDYFQVQQCLWSNNQCYDAKSILSVLPCSSIPAATCSKIINCAWYNNECQSFTKCTDYTYSKSILSAQCSKLNCFDNGSTCSFDTLGRNGEQNCEDIGSQEYCEYVYILYKSTLCSWDGSKCVGTKLTSCNGLTQTKCQQASSQCAWSGSQCSPRKCADGQYQLGGSQEDIKICSSYLDITTNAIVYCNLNDDGDCEESNPEDFDRRNCHSQSFQQYRWIPGSKTCEKCE